MPLCYGLTETISLAVLSILNFVLIYFQIFHKRLVFKHLPLPTIAIMISLTYFPLTLSPIFDVTIFSGFQSKLLRRALCTLIIFTLLILLYNYLWWKHTLALLLFVVKEHYYFITIYSRSKNLTLPLVMLHARSYIYHYL